MISLIAGYPIAFVYSILIYRLPAKLQHCYLLFFGLLLCFWNFGFQVIHMIIAIGYTYAVLGRYPATGFSVIAVVLFNLAYLFYGYATYLDYDGVISWTTPFCILVLRLIGLAWDSYDGKKARPELSEYQKRFALTQLPGLLEVFAFCFTPTAFMIGPQFPMRHFQQFVDQSLRPSILQEHLTERNSILRNKKIQRIVTRLVMATLYLAIFVKLSPIFSLKYVTSKEFLEERSLFYKLTYLGVYSKLCIIRYFVVWLIGEGASVMLGLGCTGKVIVTEVNPETKPKKSLLTDNKNAVFPSDYDVRKLLSDLSSNKIKVTEADHTAAANVSVVRFEMATNTDGFVSGHNINTNKWMLEYVYKRFRFLGNKYLSQVLTLLFLAVWHGFHSGYYVNFFLEFITVVVEKDFISIVKLSKHKQFLYDTWPGAILSTIAGKIHLFYLLGTPLTCFTLLKSAHYLPIIKSTYGIAFIYLLWPLGRPIVKAIFPRKRTIVIKDNQNSSLTKEDKKDAPLEVEEDPLDAATRLRRRSRAAVDEGAMDEEESECKSYDETAKIVQIVSSEETKQE
ncbi:Lysophosphatidylcholine acyltransferase 3 [Cichlidogyrus casuarinus]|uniref:Lysophospholipid acyltransferase 5 n=1 Tax=Cichlidogyrus casuarinus TaxID=1844966 RepID=A0ABD2Q3D3_9PLAT